MEKKVITHAHRINIKNPEKVKELWKLIDFMAETSGLGEPMVEGEEEIKKKVKYHLKKIQKLVVDDTEFEWRHADAPYYIWNCILGIQSVLWGRKWKD